MGLVHRKTRGAGLRAARDSSGASVQARGASIPPRSAQPEFTSLHRKPPDRPAVWVAENSPSCWTGILKGAQGFPKAGRRRASGLSQDGQSSELFKIVLTMLSCGDESRRAREDRHHSFTSRIHRSGPSAHGIRRLKFGDQNPSIVDSGGPDDRDGNFLHARKLKFQRTTSY